MTQEEQTKQFYALAKKMSETLISKGNDYANTDKLSNFKLAGNNCGLSAEQNCLSLIATKVLNMAFTKFKNKHIKCTK